MATTKSPFAVDYHNLDDCIDYCRRLGSDCVVIENPYPGYTNYMISHLSRALKRGDQIVWRPAPH